jgi:hypothetical protein
VLTAAKSTLGVLQVNSQHVVTVVVTAAMLTLGARPMNRHQWSLVWPVSGLLLVPLVVVVCRKVWLLVKNSSAKFVTVCRWW